MCKAGEILHEESLSKLENRVVNASYISIELNGLVHVFVLCHYGVGFEFLCDRFNAQLGDQLNNLVIMV